MSTTGRRLYVVYVPFTGTTFGSRFSRHSCFEIRLLRLRAKVARVSTFSQNMWPRRPRTLSEHGFPKGLDPDSILNIGRRRRRRRL